MNTTMNMRKLLSSFFWAIPFGAGIGIATNNVWIGAGIILAFTSVAYQKKVKQKTGC